MLTDDTLVSLAGLLRRYHRAAASFNPAGHAGFAGHWRAAAPVAWRARRWCLRHRDALLTAAR